MSEPVASQPVQLKSTRTETIFRQFDENGKLESETLTIVIETRPVAEQRPTSGGYL